MGERAFSCSSGSNRCEAVVTVATATVLNRVLLTELDLS